LHEAKLEAFVLKLAACNIEDQLSPVN